MSFKITISENGKYIIGKVEGRLNREIAQQLAKEYVKLITSTGIKRILNDVRGVPDAMGILNGYEYAYKDVNTLGLPRDIRAAIVADEDDFSHDFQEIVARNAGYILKVFHSFEQAVDWLLADSC
jgi:hypothetical protein